MRYKQTVIGVAWAIVRPFLTMIIFTVVFGRLAKLSSDGAMPYPVLVFAGMLPWFLFSSILGEASNSLVSNAKLVGKSISRASLFLRPQLWWRSWISASTSAAVRPDVMVRLLAQLADRVLYRSS